MKNFIKIIALCLLFVLLLTGCKKQAGAGTGSDAVKTITIPLVTWGGYAALFAANNGSEPTENSLFYKYGKFKVKLVQVEDASLQLSGFAKGDYQMIWSTMDMLPLIYDSLKKDPNTVPKVIGLFDYSAGGDGIIARHGITKGSDLKGKKIVVAQYTPSHYFILWYLKENNINPQDVKMIYAEDAIAAKDTFIADSNIDICVTWSPFIYDITDKTKNTYVKGSTLLISTAPNGPAHGYIADVYIARADLVKKNPEIINAFTKAMVEGYDLFNKNKEVVGAQIASLFGIKGGSKEVMGMFNDVTIGGKIENKNFFDKNNKFSAFKIFQLAADLYKNEGKLPKDFSVNPEEVVASESMLNAIGK